MELKLSSIKNKVTWADILHHAADVELGTTSGENKKCDYSCDAIMEACWKLDCPGTRYALIQFLKDFLGLNTGMQAFSEFEKGFKRQAARYNWLKFAALYCEEQGL